MPEYLDVVDENGQPTGAIIERAAAHREGVPHRTAHLWLVRTLDNRIQVLLQKRALTKSFPGCYDISSAGHIPAGQDYIPSAIRELKEELGLIADGADLIVSEYPIMTVSIQESFCYGQMLIKINSSCRKKKWRTSFG